MKLLVWVRTTLVALLVGFATTTSAIVSSPILYAAPCTFEWDPSPDWSVTGYAFYYGPNDSTGITYRLDVGNITTATFSELLANQEYFFYVVAYNAEGLESEPSNVLFYTPPIFTRFEINKIEGGMNVQFRVGVGTPCRVEYTPTLNPPDWHTLTNVVADATGNITIVDPLIGNPAARFYRVVGP